MLQMINKTIVWDVDDVLNDLTKEWFNREWLIKHPDCNIIYDELFHNPPHLLLNISIEEYLQSLDDFRMSHGHNLNPLKEVYNWFKQYGHLYRNIVLTSTPLFYASFSAQWVFLNYGSWICSYNFIPSPRKDSIPFEYFSRKSDFLSWLGKVDLYIDDNEINVFNAQAENINSVLFPRPWNRSSSTISQFLEKLVSDYLIK